MHLLNYVVDDIYWWNILYSNHSEVERIWIAEFMMHKKKTSQRISLHSN